MEGVLESELALGQVKLSKAWRTQLRLCLRQGL